MLEPLLSAVSSHYGLSIVKHEILHKTNRTLVVSLDTTQECYVLKSIYVEEERLRFILDAENYLRQRGMAIPITFPTLNKEPYLRWEENRYVLQEKIQGIPQSLSSPDAIASKASLIGMMHAASLGFHSSFGPDYAEEYYWEMLYDRKIKAISKWKERFSKTRSAKKRNILKMIDYYLVTGTSLKQQLQMDPQFQAWRKQPVEQHFIAHGDFHSENVLHTRDRIYIIDWEFVRYDFPSKDIARILNSISKHYEPWNATVFQNLLNCYRQFNPLNDWQMQMVFLDLSFPHAFYRFLQNRAYKNMSLEEVNMFLQREHDKTSYLLHLLKNA
ncbi:phosphotransferase [Paenibacillus bouchesdurhonensis]|uniref:phosphotransferase n=1 Tax=Paenibacillus bouchesdurhonensis TaxID=1870990 RepID=UPI000DA632B7|nr:phosphotransferase [Paenibacillus bouchesdurhonensis]